MDEKYYNEIPEETGAGRPNVGQVAKQANNAPGTEIDMHQEPLRMKEQKEDEAQKAAKGIASIESHRKQGDHP